MIFFFYIYVQNNTVSYAYEHFVDSIVFKT